MSYFAIRASSCSKKSPVFMRPPTATDRRLYQPTGWSVSDADHLITQVARMKARKATGFLGLSRQFLMQFTEQFDVVVVGAGHAGCEAAMASARMGLKTALYTLNVDLIAQMSCNPAVGGIAKGHLVREVDALGGIMGEITDAVGIQFRLLNTSRGPAVWSPRAQCDKQQYRLKMREVLESQPNLKIKQAEVADLIMEPSCQLSAVGSEPGSIPESAENRELRTENSRRVLGIRLREIGRAHV